MLETIHQRNSLLLPFYLKYKTRWLLIKNYNKSFFLLVLFIISIFTYNNHVRHLSRAQLPIKRKSSVDTLHPCYQTRRKSSPFIQQYLQLQVNSTRCLGKGWGVVVIGA